MTGVNLRRLKVAKPSDGHDSAFPALGQQLAQKLRQLLNSVSADRHKVSREEECQLPVLHSTLDHILMFTDAAWWRKGDFWDILERFWEQTLPSSVRLWCC